MSGSEYSQKQKRQTNKQNPTNNKTNIYLRHKTMTVNLSYK
jgi:hypothetical protein